MRAPPTTGASMLSRISSHILGSTPPHPSLPPLLPLGVAEDNREPLEDTHSSPGMLSLEGKVALVAGGNSGIGLAFADAMARAGAEICASDFQRLQWGRTEGTGELRCALQVSGAQTLRRTSRRRQCSRSVMPAWW